MTNPAGLASAPSLGLMPESFWAIVLRRSRYVVAIALAAFLFYTLGWLVAAPPANMGGVSLLAWPGSSSLFAALSLAAILIVATFLCTLLVHPDSPHMGLFCAVLGMTALSIRGGNVYMLLQDHMVWQAGLSGGSGLYSYAHISGLLALECIHWAIIIFLAEAFTRLLHDRFFANTHWITRSGPDLTTQMLSGLHPAGGAMGMSLYISQKLGTETMRRRVATPLAVIYSTLAAALLLYMFLQSILKGQVLFACFAAFFLATLSSYLAFPRVPFPAFVLAVPLSAAAGYLYGMNSLSIYPGQPGFFMARALPIDYIGAGIPGAILGYYAAFRWSLHTPSETD